MKKRPIIFSGEMVRAILDGRKRMTRRVMEPQPMPYHDGALLWQGKIPKTAKYYSVPPYGCFAQNGKVFDDVYCPYGKVGDRLWVREAVRITRHPFIRPSISRWASRITLEITEVRVERLQDITVNDVRAEGVEIHSPAIGGARAGIERTFGKAWDKVNGKKHPWASNPWVWVIKFEVVK